MELNRRKLLVGSSLVAMFALSGIALASQETEEKAAAQLVDTAVFKKPGPYKVGVSCGWLSASWVVYSKQYILWAAEQNKADVSSVVFTDAAFNPSKQVSDIEDLLKQGVDILIYWAVDDKSVADVLKRAVDSGVPTINAYGSFVEAPGTTTNAYVSQWAQGEMIAKHLVDDLKGEGKIVAILPIAGTTASNDLLDALKTVLKQNPKVELLDVAYGDYNRAKAKQVAENLLQRFPDINGIFSPSGNQSLGIVEAVEEAGRLNEIRMSASDELNGWVKWVVKNNNGGVATYPPSVGKLALELGLKIRHGESVPRGVRIPSEYYSPAEAAKIVRDDLPDDAWPGSLPPEFLPK